MANETFSVGQIQESLTRKVGPLPVWGWGAIILVGLLYWRYRNPSGGSSEAYADESSLSTSPAYYDYGPATGDAGGGSTGGSAGSTEDWTTEEPLPAVGGDNWGLEPAPAGNSQVIGIGRNERNQNGRSNPDSVKLRPVGRGPGPSTADRTRKPPKSVSGKPGKQGKGQNKLPANKKHQKPGKPSNKQKDTGGKGAVPYTPTTRTAYGITLPGTIPSNAKNAGGSGNGVPHAGIPPKATATNKSEKQTQNKGNATLPNKSKPKAAKTASKPAASKPASKPKAAASKPKPKAPAKKKAGAKK